MTTATVFNTPDTKVLLTERLIQKPIVTKRPENLPAEKAWMEMKTRLNRASTAPITSGRCGISLHTLSEDANCIISALMYGFRKRHGERRFK